MKRVTSKKREQFSICVRYICTEKNNNQGNLQEDFLGFDLAKDLSSQSLAKWGLDLDNMVGQGDDGAANMSG